MTAEILRSVDRGAALLDEWAKKAGDSPIAPKRGHTPNAPTGDTGDTGDGLGAQGFKPSPAENRGPGTPGTGFRVAKNGVWFESPDDADKPAQWICSPLHVTAMTRDVDGESWGRLLEFEDPDGRVHRWACPMELLAGDGTEFRRILLSMGLKLAPGAKARQLVAQYVQTAKTPMRGVCTGRTGWHKESYVLPDETLGEGTERVLLQTLGEPPKMRVQGDAESWRDSLGTVCAGNTRLVLAVSAAFAGPLLDIVGDESGGIHLVGSSSTGKTTALRLAASVWGGPEYVHRWRATANGLEAVAAGHNDALLVLDELAQVDPREAGEIAYMLANGAGKHRARRDGLARTTATWRLLFLSAGEVGLADHMAAAGKRSRAGQEVRLVDIPADADCGHGVFEELHGHKDGAGIADAIASRTRENYGRPARVFLRGLVETPRQILRRSIEELREDFVGATVPAKADGQARRVAGRFGLIAAAGEMASAMGLTGWPKGESIRAATVCYQAWIDRRGGSGSQESAAALAQVQHFIEAHGASRFQDLDTTQDRTIHHRAGYIRRTHQGRQYLFLTEVFRREVCAGLDYRVVARALKDHGLLVTEGADRWTLKPRGIGRVYAVLDPSSQEGDSHAE